VRWVIRRLLSAVVLLALAGTARAEDSAAGKVVRRLNDALVGVLKQAEALGYQGRVTRLAPAVREAFDVPFMAEKSLAQHWKALGATDRERWLALSHEFSVANYAANFDHYTGQTIEMLGEEQAPNDTVVVRTRIVDPKGENVEMGYRLRQTGGGWKIIDVFLKGTVSELALRRSDYTSVLEREGFEALVATMRARIADLAAGRSRGKGP
jgi:phospholipid transport system substrate-binding protein